MSSLSFEAAYDFTGKVVLVTGGAAGIGQAVARLFAERGATLVLVDRAAEVEAAAAGLPGIGHLGLIADVTSTTSLEAVVRRIIAGPGKIDVLVNNAGVARLAPAETITEVDWDVTMAVNLRAPFVLSQLVGREMLRQGSGRIINIASQAGIVAIDQHIAYCRSNA